MNIGASIAREFENAPIGTTAAFIAVISIFFGGGIAVSTDGIGGAPGPLKYGLAVSLSLAVAFLIARASSNHLPKAHLSSLVVHSFLALIFATISNTFFWLMFPETSTSGGFTTLVMGFTGAALALVYQMIFFERWDSGGSSSLQRPFFVLGIFFGVLVTPVGVYIPIL